MEITVTAKDVQAFRSRPGNPHMLRRGAGIQIISEDLYRTHPTYNRQQVVVTRKDLADVDPQADTYGADFLASLLTDYANNS
jgi:hypothetical protein